MAILPGKSSKSCIESCWEPPVDVYHTPCGWTIKVELAGVDLNDIDFELHGAALTILGIRRDWIVDKDWRHHSMEISYCRFRRDIDLPQGMCGGLITSEYRNGMLLIHVTTEGGGR